MTIIIALYVEKDGATQWWTPYLTVSYDDEVTAEQVKAVDDHLAPEFTRGDWKTVESE